MANLADARPRSGSVKASRVLCRGSYVVVLRLRRRRSTFEPNLGRSSTRQKQSSLAAASCATGPPPIWSGVGVATRWFRCPRPGADAAPERCALIGGWLRWIQARATIWSHVRSSVTWLQSPQKCSMSLRWMPLRRLTVSRGMRWTSCGASCVSRGPPPTRKLGRSTRSSGGSRPVPVAMQRSRYQLGCFRGSGVDPRLVTSFRCRRCRQRRSARVICSSTPSGSRTSAPSSGPSSRAPTRSTCCARS